MADEECIRCGDQEGSANSMCQLIIKESWINPSFMGLFADRDYQEGEVICVYFGRSLRTTEAMRLVDKSYLMRLGEQCYVDSLDQLDCLARYINDCRNPCGYNVKFCKHPEKMCADVIAIRNIAKYEELFVDYGKRYWAGSPIAPVRLSFSQLNALRGILT